MERTDLVAAKVGILLAVLLLGLRLLASQVFLLVIPSALGTGSALYYLAAREQRTDVSAPTLPGFVVGLLPSLVLFGLAGIVLLVHLTGTRTDVVYLLTGAVGALVFAQVLFVEERSLNVGSVLTQVFLAALVVRLTALFATPGYVGVDIWTHATVLIDGIAREGSLAPLGESKYIMAPIYHTFGAVGALVFDSVRSGLYLSMGLLVPLSSLFVYATGRLLLPARWALLATALYAFSDQFIRWGMHIIPTSLGLVFFLAATYLVARLFYADAERWAVVLLLVASLAVVFTHQVSTVILLALLGIATSVAVVLALTETEASAGLRGRTPSALVGVFVVTLTTTIVSWMNTPFSAGSRFLWRELAVLRRALTEEAGFLNLAGGSGPTVGTPTEPSVFAGVVPYVELFGFALLLAAAVTGGLWMLRWNDDRDIALTYVLTSGTLFVAVFGLSLFGIRVLLPGRWLAFLFAPMALLAAVGLGSVSKRLPGRVLLVAFVLLAVGYPSTMVVAEKATLDSPAFEDEHKRFAYTESELAAVSATEELRPPADDTAFGTDHPYYTVFERGGGYETIDLVLGSDGPTEADVTVYRDYQSTGPVTFDASTEDPPSTEETTIEALVCPPSWNKVYANDAGSLCTSVPPATEGDG